MFFFSAVTLQLAMSLAPALMNFTELKCGSSKGKAYPATNSNT